MMRYFAEIAFDGTSYNGWQTQPAGNTIQDEITAVMARVLAEPKLEIVGCGRTDTGVHAKQFYFHFDVEASLENEVKLMHKFNLMLPKAIGFKHLFAVDSNMHARFDACERTYNYYIHSIKDPFLEPYSWLFFRELDMQTMNHAAGFLCSVSDFSSFEKTGADAKTSICRVSNANWRKVGSQICFTITSDRFLRNMVRAIVGTLIEVGLKRMSMDEFKKVVSEKSRQLAGPSVPAKGLFLTRIKYPFDV
jgi:tRNA pseudouridine38-40 synthase